MSYIYKITNNINNKLYIGKTNQTVIERFIEHCQDSAKASKQDRPLYKAMSKYGVKNFSIEQIEECTPDEANDREKYWIEYYGSFKNGYNATLGGDGAAYLDYDLIYHTYQQVKSMAETARLIGCCEDSVKIVLKNYNISQEEIILNSIISQSKSVAMIDKETKEIIKVFTSTHEAGRYLNKTHQHIQEVCQGKRKSAYGYFWKYLEDYECNELNIATGIGEQLVGNIL